MDTDEITSRLNRIESLLSTLIKKEKPRDYYTTAEIAKILGKAEFTVREWARNGRIWAEKRQCGRGRSREWMISHVELERIQDEGLLPD
ncbi:hypothetical protein FHS27_004891 [Rhodopirellula rubra]|uniref:Helix-turn-helix domain-containing protein n=1 Tax=Aporhodopirellula rubra TaxID=980271 RepID=A0A7W5E2R2_9BACT|nr:helix-turn-helix domain-containing protein [Aporhodopirellula rubra]MBB3209055.1 hypothetical protein [Aporhodopirellula rubra]